MGKLNSHKFTKKINFHKFTRGINLYNIIPRLRHIDEEKCEKIFLAKEEERIARLREKDPEAVERIAQRLRYLEKVAHDGPDWEIRDEANRPWWKWFDEYEYRNSDKNPSGRKWYHWFEETDTPAERKLILKLDLLLTFFSFAMYWLKYLDQTNLNNAYVSGMKEDLNFKGNDLVQTQAMYTVGSVLFQIPFTYLVHKYPSHIILPIMDIGWGLFTLAHYRANNVAELKAFRFFVGVFEAAFFPTVQYLLGSWYKPSEYARRCGFFYFGQMLGVLTAGLLQGAIYAGLHMHNGLEGWRHNFWIDAVITIPVGIIGFWVLPGTPRKCYSLFLTDEEVYLSRKRLTSKNIKIESTGPGFFTWGLWKQVLTTWQIWLFTFINSVGYNNSNASSGSFVIWLKSLGTYSIPKVNQLSAVTPALGIVWITIGSLISDLLGTRLGGLVFCQSFNLLGNVLLAIWYIPIGLKWFAFCLQFFGWSSTGVLYSWVADSTRHNPQHRAIVVVLMNMIGQATAAWCSVLVWKTVESPRYLKGFSFTAACTFTMIVTAFVIMRYYKRDERRTAIDNGILVYNSAKGESPPEIPPAPSNDSYSDSEKRSVSTGDNVERIYEIVDPSKK